MSQHPNEESVNDYVLQTTANSDKHSGSPAKTDEDEDEDEDIDFNPFLKETPSPEASSSLSSEIEEVEIDAVEAGVESFHKGADGVKCSTIQDPFHSEEETCMPRAHPPKEIYETDLQESTSKILTDKELEISENENQVFCKMNDPVSGEIDRGMVTNDVKHSQKSAVLLADDDNNDAICKRTRARYSLASFTLDELESFLQETDDDDDLPNVDDEEEYRKFLAAVLQGRDVDEQAVLESGNFDDEDEDNDADFEIELEEALESDIDERPTDISQKESSKHSGRRPETRQNRRQRSSTEYKRKLLEQSKRPLRPLLPLLPMGLNANNSLNSGGSPVIDTQSNSSSLPAGVGSVNGFTPFQIGQLYCLIHEHVQLLIQIYSLCILDPPRQRIASQLRELIFEMLEKCDQVVACRTAPYPDVCFWPPYLLPSVLDGHPRSFEAQPALDYAPAYGAQGISFAQDNQILTNVQISSSNKQQEHACDGVMGSYQAVGGLLWLPITNGPVLSILDVAPLNLVKKFMDDMDVAVQDHRRRHFESASETRPEREPLFPLANISSAADGDSEVLKEVASANTVKNSSISNQQPQKRSLAAALVESTKKQSVALVPKDVAKSAQMFCPLFNQALFPRKPPPVAVASRVLFTDTEDELLALGMMEYNTDWKAIQQRFLPCKSKHQIFVRQKNRCSSKAPDNPIKVVRRMKTSALTEEELKRIQEGLKIYKLDWMSVWKFIVPHRDPSLLPRQYRIALGTQKSYKQDPVRKEKRRIYEAERRKRKDANLPSWQHDSNKEKAKISGRESSSGDGCIDDPEEAYVHEAFLADWAPSTYSQISSRQPALNIAGGNQQNTQNGKEGPVDNSMEAQSHKGNMHRSPSEPNSFQHPYATSVTYHGHVMPGTLAPGHGVSSTLACPPHHTKMNFTPGSHLSWSCQGRQIDSTHLVKLAPNLPPLNLPRNVRVLSQSAYRNHLDVHNTQAGVRDAIPQHPTERSWARTLPNGSNIDVTTKEPVTVKEKHITEGSHNVSDLQMHPLLFQAPEDGCQLYNPSSCHNSPSSSFSFFSGNQPQLNLTLFHNHNPLKPVPSIEKSSKSPGVDFHPLLQRMDDASTDWLVTRISDDPSTGLDSTSAQDCNNNDHAIPSQNDGRNELDLEIHLSSVSRDGINLEILDQNANERRLVACQADIENALKANKTSSLFGQQNEGYINRELFSKSQNSLNPNDGITRYSMDTINDQSQAEIVMEQEELSDSDEDEENVEFECEEMADSEGEDESGTEACTKEASIPGMENVNISADRNCRPREVRNQYGTTADDTIPCDNTPSSESGLACNQKDTSKSWLSLDSCPRTGVTSRKVNPVPGTAVEGVNRSSVSSHSDKASKKLRPCAKGATVQQHSHVVEIVREDAGALPSVAAGRPRKRACKRNSNADGGVSAEINISRVKRSTC